jgi:3'-phosphoadenosine 5'-phosphosulfate sulfotransferase (PAPS reductase)/FAD synthetase
VNYENKLIVASISGGKDSTAMALHLLEQGYTQNDFVRIFFDTGWEHKTTYDYLDYLETQIGPIQRFKLNVEVNPEYKTSINKIENMLGFESPFVRLIYKKGIFPNGRIKYCTDLLKLKLAKQYYDLLDCDFVNLVGVRAEESKKRAQYDEWEYNNRFDCYTHRPLLRWDEKQVIDIHKRFNIMPNPLYLHGWDRVGCYPCIYSNKTEVGKIENARVEIIRIIENDLHATFFKRNGINFNIDDTIRWAKTSHGGKQFMLFDVQTPTCEKWGLCSFTG